MSRTLSRRAGCIILAILAAAACCAMPAAAAVRFSQGSPEFTAAIAGTTEFVPGQEVMIPVLVQNNGVNLFKQVNRGTIAQEDLPNAAKSVTVALKSDTPLITVKSDPQEIGTIVGNGGSVLLTFTVKISADATAENYVLPLLIGYEVPVVMEQGTSDTFEFLYAPEEVTIPLTIRSRPGVRVEVLEVVTVSLSPGSEGYVTLKIRNSGPDDGREAVVTVRRSGQSPVIPVDSSVYVGEFPSGGSVTCLYKVAVSDEAGEETYPAEVAVSYRNREGSAITSLPVTVGVAVMGKPAIPIVSDDHQVHAGSTGTITVRYRNEGPVPVYDANARITAHDPVSFDDSVAYIGDMQPGETKDALFRVAADKAAEPGVYSFDSRVRYRDASGSSLESDTTVMRLQILRAREGILENPGVIAVIGVAVIGILALFAYRYRKGAQ